MDKLIRIREYTFPGRAPEDLSKSAPESEAFLDREARLVRFRGREFEEQFKYGPDGKLLKKTRDDLQGCQVIETYEYDPDGELCHIHKKRQQERHEFEYTGFRGSEWVEVLDYVPTGEKSDEWYEWLDGGRTCHIHFTSSFLEDGVRDETWIKKYNDTGQLMFVGFESGPEQLFPLEVYSYREDGSVRDVIRAVPDEEKGHVFQRGLYDNRERVVCIKEKGKPDRRFTYHDHESGFWDSQQELGPDGTIISEVIRTIEKTEMSAKRGS